jgi:protein-L-isoaspartate(D-aspartate) O-methyltransferase
MSGADLADELRGAIRDERVLAAIAAVPRERFVPEHLAARAYENVALPIGDDQTISQPLVVAHMCELLELTRDDRVLDVGTGSGYHAAVLARLAGRVFTIEVRSELAEAAHARLGKTVSGWIGDGLRGLPDEAPFDAIVVAAAVPYERLGRLMDQLAPGGRLVAPLASGPDLQQLTLIRRDDGGFSRSGHGAVSFVPIVQA